MIPELINIYKGIYQIEGEFECILSVDAASLDRPNKHSHSHVFALYLQPINPKYKCFPIQIFSKSDSNCDNEVISLINEAVKASGIFVRAIASDGDPGYNDMAKDTFDKYIPVFKKHGFYAAVESIMKSGDAFHISDLLHIVKFARKRIIKGPITISSSLKSKFSKETLESILNLGIVLTDDSSLGFMKDYYPIKLFCIQNTLHLFHESKFNEFLYFLPFSLWIESKMSLSLTKKSKTLFAQNSVLYVLFFF